jgi:hypothetical protein
MIDDKNKGVVGGGGQGTMSVREVHVWGFGVKVCVVSTFRATFWGVFFFFFFFFFLVFNWGLKL